MRSAHFFFVSLICLTFSNSVVRADDQTAADLLPESTIGYFEISDPSKLLETALSHPLRAKIEALDDVKKAMNGAEFAQFRIVLKFVELQLGMDWQTATKVLTKGGIHVGFDAETEGAVMLLKASDEDKLTKIRTTFLKLARDDAERKGNPDPVESKDYRGITAYKIDKGVHAQYKDWYLITNKGDLAKKIADGLIDGNDKSLASSDAYQNARKNKSDGVSAWAFLNFAAVRNAGVANDVFKEKHDNPVLELLAGGVVSALEKTPYVTFEFTLGHEATKLSAQIPSDPKWMPEKREFFFGQGGEGTLSGSLLPQKTILSLDAFRDIGRFWLAKEDLFEENVVAAMTQADSQFSTIFSGLDFGREVLGSLKTQSQIVVARQDYSKIETPQPDIKLPAGAFIVRLKEAEKIQQRFKVAFQSLMGLTNFGLSQQGQPQFDINTERAGDARIVSATYLTDDESEDGLINYNFSPSIAYVKDWFIISSTRELAHELAVLATNQDDGQAGKNHTAASFQVGEFEKILAENRKHLVAGNILEKGHTKEEAEKEIGTLLDLLKAGKDASIRLVNNKDSLALELQVSFNK